jgi:hypothetical protein
MSGYTLSLEENGSTVVGETTSEVVSGDVGVGSDLRRKLYWVTLLLLFLSFVYLFGFNGLSTRGYEIVRLERERIGLLNEREQNNVLLSESQALAKLEVDLRNRGMADAPAPDFYWIENGSRLALN